MSLLDNLTNLASDIQTRTRLAGTRAFRKAGSDIGAALKPTIGGGRLLDIPQPEEEERAQATRLAKSIASRYSDSLKRKIALRILLLVPWPVWVFALLSMACFLFLLNQVGLYNPNQLDYESALKESGCGEDISCFQDFLCKDWKDGQKEKYPDKANAIDAAKCPGA